VASRQPIVRVAAGQLLWGVAMSEGASYRATSRPYVKRYGYQYRRHVFDKLRALDLVLAEFQQLLGRGEVIAEAEDGSAELRELVLLVEWSRPLHVVIVVDSRVKRRDWSLCTSPTRLCGRLTTGGGDDALCCLRQR
jgi:hypothetical protein